MKNITLSDADTRGIYLKKNGATLGLLIILLLGSISFGQTNPTAQSLPYTQDFSTFTGSVTTYPAGWQGWDVAGSLSTTYVTSAPSVNRSLSSSGNNNTSTRGVYDMTGKMGICSTSTSLSTPCLAINTSSLTSINVSFKVGTQYCAGRINELGLQYRVGTSGSFTDVASSTYQNAVTLNSGTGTAAINIATIAITLPVAAENKAVVQLRWMIKDVGGSGNRTNFSIDDISISGASAGISSLQSGSWSSTSTWAGGVVPLSNVNVTIASGHVVTLDNTTNGINTRDSGTETTIVAGGTLASSVQYINNGTTTVNGTFQLNAGGYTNSGNNFIYGANGTLNFNNTSSYGVNNSDQYWPISNGPYNVTILQGGMTLNGGTNRTVFGVFQTASGITLNSTLTLNGTVQINAGGYFVNSPIYGNASTLVYNGVSSYGVYNEWTGNATTAGSGTPQNVTLTNSSVNMPTTARSLAGNLTIGNGSTLSLDGTFGADLNIGGNWSNLGTFNPATRLVQFRGAAAQSITGATTFDYLTINNSSTGVTLLNDVTVNSTLDLTVGKLTLGANNLTVGGTIVNGGTTNYVVTNSTGQLKRTVGSSDAKFPVGNSAYDPITFNNTGGTSDVYGVRVIDGAITTGLNNTKTVSRRWVTTEAVAGGSNLSVVAQYNSGEENSGFAAASTPFIGFYSGSAWSQVGAVIGGSNPYTATSSANSSPANLTTGTQYFAVGKDNAFLSVASQLVITAITPASPGAGYGFSVTVRSQDAFGAFSNVIADTPFTLSTNGNAGAIGGTINGTILAGTSTVTVAGVTLASAGTGVTITATRNSGDLLTAGTSSTFTVLAAANHIAFVGVPASGSVGVNLASFSVEVRRADDSVDTFYTSNVTLSKASGSGIFSGTLTVAAVNGIATFNAVQFDTASTYTISASSGSFASITSGNIVINIAPIAMGNYPFTGVASVSGPAARLLPNGVVSNVSLSSYGLSGLTINNASSADDDVLSVKPTMGSFGTAINTALYEEFIVTPASGYYLNLDTFTFSISRTGAGATNYAIRSSADNFGANITTGSISTSYVTKTITVTGSSLTAVTYRIYLYGGSSTGFVRIDGVTFFGNSFCIEPTAFAVTGGGTYCTGGAGVTVGLATSQIGFNYQLKVNGIDVGSPIAGTDAAISFGNQTTVGNYTAVGTNTLGSCNVSSAMTGSVAVSIANCAEILPEQCGITLDNINSYAYCNLIKNAQSYTWEVTNVATNQVQTVNSYIRNVRLPWLANFAYDTQYSIRVAATVGGVLGTYGPACLIKTPVVTTSLTNCGGTVASANDWIYCDIVRYAQGYQFTVTNANDETDTQTINTLLRNFKFSNLSGILASTAYNVTVRVKNLYGTYLPAGAICTITSPASTSRMVQSNDTTVKNFNVVSYPNPFTNDFSLDLTTISQEKVQINVYDMVGRLVEFKQTSISDLVTTKIGNNYQAGVYNIVVSQGNDTKTLRVVKK